MPTQTPERAPTYIPQAEALLGTSAFYDQEREDQLKAGTLKFTAETAGMRGILYTRALRLIAQATNERDIDEPRGAALRPSRLGRFALEHLPEVLDIARQLAIINTAEKALAEQETELFDELRPHQPPYLRDVVDFLNTAPSKVRIRQGDDIYEKYIHGATVEAPTGLGKTVLIARTLAGIGVGKPVENVEHSQDRIRALIIVPSQTLVEQMSGMVGDDTLQRFAPNVSIGPYYAHKKVDDTDAVVITIDQFVDSFRDGQLNGQRFDICIVDEAHNATQPLLQKTLLEHWQGGPIIGFTATPEYYPGKDVRDLLPHRIFHGDIVKFMESEGEERVLNAAQLFEVRVTHDTYLAGQMRETAKNMSPADVNQMVLREAAVDFLKPLVAQSRRGIIFCENGRKDDEPSVYAKRMAERLSELTRPDGTPLRVAVAGSLNRGRSIDNPNSNANIRHRYAAGDIDYIITVDWGREGLNEDIDVVLTVGTITSRLKFLQEFGRGTRLSDRFPVTVYGHLFTPTANMKAQSLFSLFGFEEIEQGMIIGRRTDDVEPAPLTQDTTIEIRQQATGTLLVPQPMEPGEQPKGVTLEAFPDRMQALINSVHSKTVAEALLDAEVRVVIPKGYESFEFITEDIPGSPISIRKHLREKMGFACVARFEVGNESRGLVFYFEPAAREYLQTFRGVVARIDLQREFGGVDVSIVDKLAKDCKVKPVQWFYTDGKFITHYKTEDAKLIREKFNETAFALPTDYTRVKLCAALGITESRLIDRLLPSEIDQIQQKRTLTASGMIRTLDHWSQKDGDAIVERFRIMNEIQGTLPHLVPYELASRFVHADKLRIAELGETLGMPSEYPPVTRPGRRPRCVRWEVMRQAMAQYGVRSGVNLLIDFSNLPTGEADIDPEKIMYARKVIEQLEALPSKFTAN